MGRIILDTNMMYNLLDLRNSTYDKHELARILDASATFISSISVIEGMIYYKNDLGALQTITNSIGQNYGWVNIGFLPLRDQDGVTIKTAKSIDELSSILNYYEKIKIQKESEFTRLILTQVILCIFYDTLCHSFSKNSEKTANFLSYLVAFVSGNTEHYLNRYVALFTEGYKNQSPQKTAKAEFDFDLSTASYFCQVFSIASQRNIDIFAKEKAEETEEIDRVFSDASHNHNYSEVTIKKKKEIMDMLKEHKRKLCSDPRFKNNSLALEYTFELVDRLLFRNAKFKSNDIADLLILFSLGDDMSDDRVFTHDGRLRKFLELHNRCYP